MLKLHQVSKTYSLHGRHPVHALADIDLTVTEGEFVTIVGPSGSGKSTLLFTIGAMLAPTSGTVVLDGTDVYGIDPDRRTTLRRNDIGFMFQTFNLVPYLTCLENVQLPALLAGKPRAATIREATEALTRLGLEHRLAHYPTELSVGERQRVALSRSLINRPRLLLADEPTGNLDTSTTHGVHDLLRDLNEAGQTLVVVTHDSRLAGLGTRVVSLDEGKIQSDDRSSPAGSLIPIRSRPQDSAP